MSSLVDSGAILSATAALGELESSVWAQSACSELVAERLSSNLPADAGGFLFAIEACLGVAVNHLEEARVLLRPALPLGNDVASMLSSVRDDLGAVLDLADKEFASSCAPSYLRLTLATVDKAARCTSEALAALGGPSIEVGAEARAEWLSESLSLTAVRPVGGGVHHD